MKDIYQILDEGFQSLSRLDEVSFNNCLHIAVDLTRVATYSDFKRGVLITEVLEGVFDQVGSLFEQYSVPKEDEKQIKDKIRQNIASLSSVYKNNDEAQLFKILADLRFAATSFQFHCYNHWGPTKDPRPFAGGAR